MAGHQQLGHAQTAVSLLLVMTVGYAVYAMDRTVLSSVLSVMQTSLRLTNEEVFYLGSAQYIGVLSVVFLAGRAGSKGGVGVANMHTSDSLCEAKQSSRTVSTIKHAKRNDGKHGQHRHVSLSFRSHNI